MRIIIRKFLGGAALTMLAALNSVYAQDKALKDYYVAATIPDSLKQDAHVVKRYTYEEYNVKAPGRFTCKHHSIVTILDEKGDHEAEIGLPYNKKYDTYGDIEVKIYNAAGQVIKKYKKGDMYDHSAIDDETIYSDDRILLLAHTISSYPSTVEITYDESLTSYLDLPGWHYWGRPEVAVQNAICKVIVNPLVGFRYRNVNTNIAPEKGTEGTNDTYTWKAANLKAVKPEEHIPSWLINKKVEFAANKFEFYGLPGDMDTWQNFGKWIAQLNSDVNSLTPARADEIRKMTDTIKNDKDKARFLYHYMQQSMRYVSVQLGIGGFKPFAATFVDQKKYGDCKALANYMYALLKAVNIPSYYTVVNAGTNAEPADPAFPSDPFNHIILCIPFKSDTTWLECTNMQQPFGKLGPFTENRRALLITEDGGKLVNTPRSTMEDNRFDGIVHLALKADGSAKASLKFLTTGDYRDLYLGIASGKLDEQKKILMEYLNLKQPSTFEFKNAPDVNGVKETDFDLEYDSFCDVSSGNRQFYRPGVLDLWNVSLPDAEKRRNDYYFDHPMQKSCITTIDLPEGFDVESLPADVNLKFTYGDYHSVYKYDAAKNQVIGTVKFNLNNQVIPAAKYAEMQTYMEGIAKAQNKKLVIKRKG